MQTDKGGQQGPRSERAENQRYRQPDRSSAEKGTNDGGNQNNTTNSNNGGVPGFTFPFPGMPNGFPGMPPGFMFPGNTPAQPPPPGAS